MMLSMWASLGWFSEHCATSVKAGKSLHHLWEPSSFATVVLMRSGEGKGQSQGHMGSYSSPQWSLILLCNFPFVDLSLSLPRVIGVGFTKDWTVGENTSSRKPS